mmetsp:Transcript_10165/g.17641  ORF Transcript_10165/g.17641 Transcript_10165/m.17641 type:complete len:281 (-) Transcript_10165:910-1752(-)
MNLHLNSALEVLDELRCDMGNVVHLLVLEHGTECRLLYRLGGEGFAKKVIRDIGHLTEHRQVGGTLDFETVRPGLAQQIFFAVDVSRRLALIGIIRTCEWGPAHLQQTHIVVRHRRILHFLHALLFLSFQVVQQILRPVSRSAEMEVVVKHEVNRIVSLRQLVVSAGHHRRAQLHHLIFQQRQLRQELLWIDQNAQFGLGVLHAYFHLRNAVVALLQHHIERHCDTVEQIAGLLGFLGLGQEIENRIVNAGHGALVILLVALDLHFALLFLPLLAFFEDL